MRSDPQFSAFDAVGLLSFNGRPKFNFEEADLEPEATLSKLEKDSLEKGIYMY
ncbi:hypothetical protein KbCgl_02870 [Corynebacterium glutamicum]|nr:hypothetical protein KbCgl_02870 [Corynebacterium glutamicum]